MKAKDNALHCKCIVQQYIDTHRKFLFFRGQLQHASNPPMEVIASSHVNHCRIEVY